MVYSRTCSTIASSRKPAQRACRGGADAKTTGAGAAVRGRGGGVTTVGLLRSLLRTRYIRAPRTGQMSACNSESAARDGQVRTTTPGTLVQSGDAVVVIVVIQATPTPPRPRARTTLDIHYMTRQIPQHDRSSPHLLAAPVACESRPLPPLIAHLALDHLHHTRAFRAPLVRVHRDLT